MNELNFIQKKIREGDFKTLAKAITLVENELPSSAELLQALNPNPITKVVGITGPPGAGKSSLVNALLKEWTTTQKKIAVLSIDPSSPFNFGALLGDRIRMSDYYLHPDVFIRSIASRGSLGGLSATISEIIDLVRASMFDYILIETVGVGQSEVEIAGIADTTIVVMVPEAGDEVQTMKAGIMEIADIFVVNKSDRPNSDIFVKNLKLLSHSNANDWENPVVKCVATEHLGIQELVTSIDAHQQHFSKNVARKAHLLTEKAFALIQHHRMKTIDKQILFEAIRSEMRDESFNLYRFVKGYY